MTDPRPELPPPACRVVLIAGPPAAGKSTYVAQHAQPGDITIDFDDIAREFGYGRERDSDAVGMILLARNRRLKALARAPADITAWVIIGAPGKSLREWWCKNLHVADGDCVVLAPARDVLRERIRRDRARREAGHDVLVDKWFERERNNDPGWIKRGCDATGIPTDPLHPWNQVTR